MIHFWAKTTSEGKPGISVHDHMVNVGCVAQCIAEAVPALLAQFQMESSVVGALAALHDLGKISPGFQRKCAVWLQENRLTDIARNGCWDTEMESDHSKVSHSVIQNFLCQQGIPVESAQYIATVLGAHHGKIKYLPNAHGIRPSGQITETNSGIDWNGERQRCAQRLWNYFNLGHFSIAITDNSPAIWWLAGLTSIADWIGSDERFFSTDRRTEEVDVPSLARNALDAIGFRRPEFIRDLSFHDLFHDSEKPEVRWAPNEMQEKSLAIVSAPGVYVIEAPMGMGKTEAALWAAYQLLVAGKATGIYFALPTQATSNRMHLRMKEFVRRICRTSNATRLIHGNSWLIDEEEALLPVATSHDAECEDARTGRDWFSSAKRALIAPFGVGTVDQALLGVVAAKHFFVRHFALAGKVVILDEIHSYDLYTGTLIDKLISTLESLGCTVIILSATLTGKRRGQIVSCLEDDEGNAKLPYPLITGRSEGHPLKSVATTPPAPRTVKIDFVTLENATEEAIAVARNGGAVLSIYNTIGAAQKQYQRFEGLVQDAFPIGLLHSRFPYWRREMIEEEWMERLDKSGKKRCGSILVSTQIVEQSVDLDADLIITELAPTDMLLQRLGRLWRHERRKRPVDAARFRIIKEEKSIEEFRSMEPKAIVAALGGKAHVYDPFILLRTLQLWENYSNVVIPTQIRELIEATYRDRDDDPKSWEKLFDDRFVRNSNERFKAAMNSNYWQLQLSDEEGVQTRLNEMPTIALVLCRSITEKKVVFIDGTSAILGGKEFQLATAQTIHKNLVKVPKYCFDNIASCPAFTYTEKHTLKSKTRPDHVKHYIHGVHSVGIVAESGAVRVKGLKHGTRLFYSDELGLVIENSSGKEEL